MAKLIDLTGQRFGRLVVIEKAPNEKAPNGNVKTMWRCKCDCGNEVIRSSQDIRKAGDKGSCGCYRKEVISKVRLEDITGQRFGKLVVIKRVANDKNRLTRWLCKCDCGNECEVYGNNLRRGHTTSCGCFREENRPNLRKKHGQTNTRIYEVWEKMKARCYCETSPYYARYGGRGITVCDEWKDNPDAFMKWAYDNGYDKDAEKGECTLDRIDNDKGYSPDNCRWVNTKVQANNRRSNKRITFEGETHTVAEWADILGVNKGTLNSGIHKGRTLEHYKYHYKPRNTHPNK